MAEPKKGELLELLRFMEEKGIAADDPRIHKAYGKFMDERSRALGYPRFGVFELTPLCNLDCKMCYVHMAKEQFQGLKLLPGTQWIRLMKDAIDHGMMSAQLSGGEALMHPDFDEIYEYLISRGVRVSIMTNGLLLTEKRIEYFKMYPPANIQITLYGGNEDAYEKVTGHRVYGIVTDHIVKALEVGCKISVTCTPSRYFGAAEVRETAQFCKEHDLKLRVNSDLNDAREETGRAINDFDLPPEEYHRIQEFMAEGKELIPAEEKDLPPVGDAAEPRQGIRCAAGRSMFCVKWNGRMQICLDIDHYEDPFSLGFEEAWKRLHEFALDFRIPMECGNCAYQKVCNLCPVQHLKGAEPGHVDRRICERTRCLVKEGFRVLPKKETAG